MGIYKTLSAGALALALSGTACEKNGSDHVAPSQLETALSTQALSEKQAEPNLSSPESPVKYFFDAMKLPDAREGHALYLKVSHEKEFADFNRWIKGRDEMKLVSYNIECGTQEDTDSYSFKVAVTTERDGKQTTKKGNVKTICKNGKWLLANK